MRDTQDAEPFARFEFIPQIDKNRSHKEGRNIFENILFVRVTKPGSRDEIVLPATEDHKKRFRNAFEAFERASESPLDGTPLNMVPIFTPAHIATMAAIGMLTLEAFVGATAEEVKNSLGHEYVDLHKRALTYLEAASNVGAVSGKLAKALETIADLQKEGDESRKTIKLLEGRIDELMRERRSEKTQQKG